MKRLERQEASKARDVNTARQTSKIEIYTKKSLILAQDER